MKPATDARMSVAVRRAALDDAPALAALAGQLGYPSSVEQVASRLAQILGRPDHVVFVAEITQPSAQPGVAGWVHGFVQRVIERDPTVEIGGLVIDADQRGLGIGGLLMDQLERWAWDTGCDAITVRSNVIRERAHAFYQRLGYALVKSQRVFRKQIDGRTTRGQDP